MHNCHVRSKQLPTCLLRGKVILHFMITLVSDPPFRRNLPSHFQKILLLIHPPYLAFCCIILNFSRYTLHLPSAFLPYTPFVSFKLVFQFSLPHFTYPCILHVSLSLHSHDYNQSSYIISNTIYALDSFRN